MAGAVLGCMATLIVEAALVANFIPSNNHAALQAAVAMFFIFQIFYGAGCDGKSPLLPFFIDPREEPDGSHLASTTGTQFSYLGELFPTHIRAKGVCLGVAMISFMNIIWLQAAPTAFEKIGWKFYLCFIIPGTIGAVLMWIFWPDTKGLPLEEIAAIFGDADEVAIYQAEIEIDRTTHQVVIHRAGEKAGGERHVESEEATEKVLWEREGNFMAGSGSSGGWA